jgi:hypothetical protein
VRLDLGEQHVKNLDQASLSNFTVKGHVSEKSEGIFNQEVAEMKD